MSKKGLSCELCANQATMFCESDQASLCWSCDEKVHAANFLVAKHCRTLLCHVCGSPTPWKAAGLSLGTGPTVSVCCDCGVGESQESEFDSDGGDFDSDATEEEEGDNQVVPWAEEDGGLFSSLKRMRNDDALVSEDEAGCCSSQNPDSRSCESSHQLCFQLESEEENCASSSASSLFVRVRPLKMRRRTGDHSLLITPEHPMAVSESRVNRGTTEIVDKLQRFQRTDEGEPSSTLVLGRL